jgi:hypothetical protein
MPALCEALLKQHGLLPIKPEPICDVELEIYHLACEGSPCLRPVLSVGCFNTATGQWQFPQNEEETLELCEKLHEQDPNWKPTKCYCCCPGARCGAPDATVALPDGKARPMKEIQPGDTVLAGSVGEGQVRWQGAEVRFSQGTQGEDEPAMAFLSCGPDQNLIVPIDQVLALADGTFTTAGQLVPGQRLLGQDGSPRQLSFVNLGGYAASAHHLATEVEWNGSVNGHLLCANGIVVGDYTLQVNFASLADELKRPDWDSLPQIGTPQYAQRHAELAKPGLADTYGLPDESPRDEPAASSG